MSCTGLDCVTGLTDELQWAAVPVDLDLPLITERLAAHQPRDPSDLLVTRRSAVAAVLRFDQGSPEVLLMQRAVHERDRWSGHVSMPGGRQEEVDPDLLATAIRETREEVGIDLTRGSRLLGRLAACKAIAKGKILPMTITPYVFHLLEPQPVVLNEEAVDHFWFPLDRAARGELDEVYQYRLGPVPWNLPCWRWQTRTVWGLTHQMLTALLDTCLDRG